MSETELKMPETETSEEEIEVGAIHDQDNHLTQSFVQSVLHAVDEGDVAGARALVEPLHAADIADLFEVAPSDERQPLAQALVGLIDGEVLAEMNDWVREELVEALAPHEVAEIASELDTDDAVAIIEDMDEEDQRAVLHAMEPEDRAAIEEALSYEEETAGRLMQRDLVAVPEHWSVADVIAYVRSSDDLPTDFWEIFVVDVQHKPVGTLKGSWVLRAPDDAPITAVMQHEQTLIPVDMDQEEVALRFQKYALISAAVVDRSGRLVGMITVDDILHIVQEEAGEDALLLSGAGEGDINEPVLLTVRTRVVWLVVNLGTAMIAAWVVSQFDAQIARFAVLAALMGIVSGMGGNAGTQTLAVVVRAIATNQLTDSNTWRMIRREFSIALSNGTLLGILICLGSWVIFKRLDLAMVFGAAILINNVVAGLAGVLIPITLDRARVDPAVSSAVFVTMCTDCMGFFSFLGLATLFNLH